MGEEAYVVSVSLCLVLPNSFSMKIYSILSIWSYSPERSTPFWEVRGYTCCPPTAVLCRAALRCGKEERWSCMEGCLHMGFRELKSISLHRLLVAVIPLAPLCAWCLFLFSLDQDETEWDSALFLLHLPCHTPTLDVGLPINISSSHSAVVFKQWRKCTVTEIQFAEKLGAFCDPGEAYSIFWDICPLT